MPPKPPTTPENLTVDAVTSTTIDLSWDSVRKADAYELNRAFYEGDSQYVNVYDGAGTEFGDTGLIPSTTYWYKVLAKNENGSSSFSAPVSGTTEGDSV